MVDITGLAEAGKLDRSVRMSSAMLPGSFTRGDHRARGSNRRSGRSFLPPLVLTTLSICVLLVNYHLEGHATSFLRAGAGGTKSSNAKTNRKASGTAQASAQAPKDGLGVFNAMALIGFIIGGIAAVWKESSQFRAFANHVMVCMTPTTSRLDSLMSPVRRRREEELTPLERHSRSQSRLSSDGSNVSRQSLRVLPSDVDIENIGKAKSSPSLPSLAHIFDSRRSQERRRTTGLGIRPVASAPAGLNSTLSIPESRRSFASQRSNSRLKVLTKIDSYGSQEMTEAHSPARSSDCESATSPGTPVTSTPTVMQLEELFEELDEDDEGSIGIESVREAIRSLILTHHVGLTKADASRLFAYLGGTAEAGVNLESFTTKMQSFCAVLAQLGEQMTFAQLKVVVAAAFDRFDLNGDGHLSLEEFIVAATTLGLSLQDDEAAILHEFFAPDGQALQQDSLTDDRPAPEKWRDAVNSSVKSIQKRSGWQSAQHLFDRIGEAIAQPGDVGEKVQRACDAVWEGADNAADAAELVVDTAGMALAMHYVADNLNGMEGLASADLCAAGPFLMFIGLSTTQLAKELDELTIKEMNEDEALLYAQVFHPAGFTQSEFRQLLSLQGCQWKTAAPGTLLSDPNDKSVKVVVKGKAEIFRKGGNSQPLAELAKSTILNSTLFLRGEQLWQRESVVTKDEVTYISWEPEKLQECLTHNKDMSLRMDRLLSGSIADLLRHLTKVRREHGLADSTSGSDAESSGEIPLEVSVVTATAPSRVHLQASKQGRGVQRLRKSDIQLLRWHMDKKLRIGEEKADCDRLYSFIDYCQLGSVDMFTCRVRLELLKGAIESLGGMGLSDLLSILRRSFSSFDVDKDGKICYREFSLAIDKLELPLNEAQRGALFTYIDMDDDGVIDLTECGCENEDNGWMSGMQVALETNAQRSGLTKFCYTAHRIGDALQGKGDIKSKMDAATKTAWQGLDGFADAAEAVTDVTGAAAALYGIWDELGGGSTCFPSCIDDSLNLAPFLIFLGISGVHMVRHLAEGAQSDLTEREAMLYTTTFEKHGFTVSQFQRLMKNARWQKLDAGQKLEDVMGPENKRFMGVVARGECNVKGGTRGSGKVAGPGEFIGEGQLLWPVDPSSPKKSHDRFQSQPSIKGVTSPSCWLAVWDVERLQVDLERDEKLQLKVHRAVAVSICDRLLTDHIGEWSAKTSRVEDASKPDTDDEIKMPSKKPAKYASMYTTA